MQERCIVGTLGAGGDEARILFEEMPKSSDVARDSGTGSGLKPRVGGIAVLDGLNLAGEFGPAFEAVRPSDE